MYAYFSSAPLQSAVVLAVALVAPVWWLTVPNLMATSTFAALCGILAASIWVVVSTIENARPASSLAQSLHDVDSGRVVKPARGPSAE